MSEDELIAELESLIVRLPKGCTGWHGLSGSDKVIAHKIDVLINKIKGVGYERR